MIEQQVGQAVTGDVSTAGADEVICRAGPGGYRLARLTSAAAPRRVEVPLGLDAWPVSVLTRQRALLRLARAELPRLFFDEHERGRGTVLYRRFDGRYALVQGI